MGTWVQEGSRQRPWGDPAPVEQQGLGKGRCRIKLLVPFRPLLPRFKKKIKLFKQKINTSSVAELGIKPSKARKFKRAAAIPPSPLNRPECYTSQWDEIQGPAGSFVQNVTSL